MPDGQMTTFEHAAMSRGHTSQATMVEQSRAVAEVQAAVVVAQSRPRDKSTAISEMREACNILPFAERAFFSFSRGGSPVKGETVHLARELARCWGNITNGIVELSRDEVHGQSEMMAFAWDLQTNTRQQTTFIVPHSRDTKTGKKAITDDRDVYENNANMGARRLREMIFAVLPVWFRDEAADLCRATLVHGGGKPLATRIADCVAGYGNIAVGRDQLEAHVGRKIDAFTPEDVAALGITYKSIARGEISKEEAFPRTAEEAKPLPANADGFEKAAARQIVKAVPAKAEPPKAEENKPEPSTVQVKADDLAAFTLVGHDGQILPFEEYEDFAKAVFDELNDAAKGGESILTGWRESNRFEGATADFIASVDTAIGHNIKAMRDRAAHAAKAEGGKLV